MATPKITQFWTCTLADSELRVNDRPFFQVYGLRFGEDWVEVETGLLYNDDMDAKQHLAMLQAAQKIEVDIRPQPFSKASPVQMLRSFCSVKLVSERYETRPFWHSQTEGSAVQHTEGKNAPVWYVILRFEVLK